MNTRHITLTILLFSTLATFAQQTVCNLKEVKTVNEKGEEIRTETLNYDQKNNVVSKKVVLTKLTAYPSVSLVKNVFDVNNNMTSSETYFNDKLTYNQNYKYDNSGKLLSESSFSNGKNTAETSVKSDLRETTSYWDNGEVANKRIHRKSDKREVLTVLDSKNQVTSEETTEFNSKGNKTYYSYAEPKVKLLKTIVYNYNAQEQLVSEIYSTNGVEYYRFELEYTDNLLMFKKGILPDKTEPLKIEYVYENNLETKQLLYSSGNLEKETVKKYDTLRNLTEEITSNNKGQILTKTNYTYECK